MKWTEYVEQNITITGYKVRYRRSGTGAMTFKDVKNDTGCTVKSLAAATEYEIQVAAYSANGCGPFSEPVVFKTYGGEYNNMVQPNWFVHQ